MLFKGDRRMNEYRECLLKEVGYEGGEDSMVTDDWFNLSFNGKLSTKFIYEFEEDLSWYHISMNNNVTEDVLREFNDRINWYCYFEECESSFSIIKSYITKTKFRTIDDFFTAHLSILQKQEIQRVLDLKYLFKK